MVTINLSFQIRWAATVVEALKQIILNIFYITSHLKRIIDDLDGEFDDDTKAKAKIHWEFLTDKHVFASMVFNMDPMLLFKQLSLDFQQKYSSLVGQKAKEMVFRITIEGLKSSNGDNFQRLLDEAICFDQDPVDGDYCRILENYEEKNVYYNGLQFYEHDSSKYPKLSTFYQSYVDKILTSIDVYFPMEIGRKTHPSKLDFEIFEPLNQYNYPEDEMNKLTFEPGNIEKLATTLNIEYDDTLQKEFISMVRMLLYDKEVYCKARKSDPLFFWTDVVRAYEDMISSRLRRLILAANVTPLSSADPERR